MSNEMKFLVGPYVYRGEQREYIARLKPPQGEDVLLTADQVVTAGVKPAGNFGHSYVTVTLTIQMEACGSAEDIKTYFAQSLLKSLKLKETELQKLTADYVNVVKERDKLAADARASAVVESALIATGQKQRRRIDPASSYGIWPHRKFIFLLLGNGFGTPDTELGRQF